MKNLRVRKYFRDLITYGRIILKWILEGINWIEMVR
jgi:hypothetical protein